MHTFRPISPYVLETVQDTAERGTLEKVVCYLSNRYISDDLQRSL